MKKRLIINAIEPREVRAVILGEDGKLERLFVERTERKYQKGDVYKARVVTIEPHLQAAFVELEPGRHAFLSINDIIFPDAGASLFATAARKRVSRKKAAEEAPAVDAPEMAAQEGPDAGERARAEEKETADAMDAPEDGSSTPMGEADAAKKEGPKPQEKEKKHFPKINEVLKRNQDVVVQIIKEGIGKKAPVVSNFLSLAGRFLVMTPGSPKVNVSRRLGEDDDRDRLKDIVEKAGRPPECGIIVRTAAGGVEDKAVQADMKSLAAFWKTLKKQVKDQKQPGVLYKEPSLICRLVRDYFSTEMEEILVDTKEAFEELKAFLAENLPEETGKLRLHEADEPIFDRNGIDSSIQDLFRSRVSLPGGGSLVFEQTEALLAIDVNSGTFRGGKDEEETAFQINLAASKELARQIMLRDVGGLIMIDFVDMRRRSNREKIMRELSKAFKDDKAKLNITRISELGVLEMSRQRTQESLRNRMHSKCEACGGSGLVTSLESACFDMLRAIRGNLKKYRNDTLRVLTTAEAAIEILNEYRSDLEAMENESDVDIQVRVDPSLPKGSFRIEGRSGGRPQGARDSEARGSGREDGGRQSGPRPERKDREDRHREPGGQKEPRDQKDNKAHHGHRDPSAQAGHKAAHGHGSSSGQAGPKAPHGHGGSSGQAGPKAPHGHGDSPAQAEDKTRLAGQGEQKIPQEQGAQAGGQERPAAAGDGQGGSRRSKRRRGRRGGRRRGGRPEAPAAETGLKLGVIFDSTLVDEENLEDDGLQSRELPENP